LPKSWLILPIAILYLTSLGAAGFLGPDEPRYASIGREMARSGDWITPRLDGQPWFEKPPLLYWMTAAGQLAHLPDEWAARLPVALASLAFLIFFFTVIEREFSNRVALAATAILATSAGWAAYSFVAVTDLPMAAALNAALLIAMFDTRPRRGWMAGVLLGLAILAKGLVPVVLIAPAWLIARRKRIPMLAGAALVAAPWFALCSWRNGAAFWNDFFWKQHVERFFQPTLEHVQPWWFYGGVLLLGMIPWTPLMGLLARPKRFDDPRVRFLAVFFVFGFVFFSAARNKLPGYLLPLLPAMAIILAYALNKLPGMAGSMPAAEAERGPAWWITACTLPLWLVPVVARALPDALLNGIRKVDFSLGLTLPLLAVSGLVFGLAWRSRPQLAMLSAGLSAVVALGLLKVSVLPVLDQRVSVRSFWRTNADQLGGACLEGIRRDWRYGFNYYAAQVLPECSGGEPKRVGAKDGKLTISAGQR
jgi:4-amino-4-deoxy-L-arabinose transferase-like glycosyltransferase